MERGALQQTVVVKLLVQHHNKAPLGQNTVSAVCGRPGGDQAENKNELKQTFFEKLHHETLLSCRSGGCGERWGSSVHLLITLTKVFDGVVSLFAVHSHRLGIGTSHSVADDVTSNQDVWAEGGVQDMMMLFGSGLTCRELGCPTCEQAEMMPFWALRGGGCHDTLMLWKRMKREDNNETNGAAERPLSSQTDSWAELKVPTPNAVFGVNPPWSEVVGNGVTSPPCLSLHNRFTTLSDAPVHPADALTRPDLHPADIATSAPVAGSVWVASKATVESTRRPSSRLATSSSRRKLKEAVLRHWNGRLVKGVSELDECWKSAGVRFLSIIPPDDDIRTDRKQAASVESDCHYSGTRLPPDTRQLSTGPLGWLGGSQLTWTEEGDRASAWRDSTRLGTWTVHTHKDNTPFTHQHQHYNIFHCYIRCHQCRFGADAQGGRALSRPHVVVCDDSEGVALLRPQVGDEYASMDRERQDEEQSKVLRACDSPLSCSVKKQRAELEPVSVSPVVVSLRPQSEVKSECTAQKRKAVQAALVPEETKLKAGLSEVSINSSRGLNMSSTALSAKRAELLCAAEL
ncbi:hypothetical protein F7725_020117 [Dissostichus mawsoni]|uniref:Uncharacterized protein n=1 Tax=Dissostichus mawsoni TaxID=36200 RepID=A0A7J5YE92_DISMA|nr:hypothetical protein F7725_020117 [Dissostichus mawsoni]